MVAGLEADSRRGFHEALFGKAEVVLDVGIRLAIEEDIGVDEEVKWFGPFLRRQANIATDCEGDPVGIEARKERILSLRMSDRLRDIHRNPPVVFEEELRPAVVSLDLSARFTFRDEKTYDKARRDAARTGKSNEERVNVSAVTPTKIAGIEGIAITPSREALIIANSAR